MNRILAICAAVALLPVSGACRADEVFPVAHKEPIAIHILDGRNGIAQAGVSVLLTGGYDRRDLAEGQWHEELVTDADGKVRLTDALRNLPLLSVEVLKLHGCGPAMAALSVERIRLDGMSAPNRCGAATVVDAGGVLTVFVKGKKTAAIAGPAAAARDSLPFAAAPTLATPPTGPSGPLAVFGSPAKAAVPVPIAEASNAVNVQPHATAGEAKGEPESIPASELAPIPFLEPISDFSALAAPKIDAARQDGSNSSSVGTARATHPRASLHPAAASPDKKTTDAVKTAQSPASKPGGKPSAAHMATGDLPVRESAAGLKPTPKSGNDAGVLQRGNFNHRSYSAEDRAAEAHARGLALAAARAAGQLMSSAAADPSARTPHADLLKSKPSAAHHGIVSPGSATAPAPLPARSTATAEDAGDTECVPVK